MDRQELLKLLKENLNIRVFHPEHDTGYCGVYMEEDTENITVEVYFGDELICRDSSRIY